MARRSTASKEGAAEEIKKEKKEVPGIEESFRMLDELRLRKYAGWLRRNSVSGP